MLPLLDGDHGNGSLCSCTRVDSPVETWRAIVVMSSVDSDAGTMMATVSRVIDCTVGRQSPPSKPH